MSFCQSCGTALGDSGTVCAVCTGSASAGGAVAAMPAPASTGLQNNAVGALAYLGGLITGILFLVIDPYKTDRFVRFHSFQSIYFNVAWIGLWIVWMIVGLLLGVVTKGHVLRAGTAHQSAADGWGLLPLGLSHVQRLSEEDVQTSNHRRPCRKAGWALMLRLAPSSRVRVRGLRALTRSLQAARPLLLFALVLCFAASGCRHSESHEREAQKQSPGAPSSSTSLPAGMDMFDLKAHPNATILHPVDLKTLTESERKFGIAPKRGPKVEYQPNIILMEEGDKAIRAIANDGMTWTFDANAPHVSEFQMGKIVFATGRAVGRIIWMQRNSDDVKVILGPIQLTDVINKGEFAMSSPIDMNNVLVFTAPDLPEPREVAQKENTSLPHKPWAGWNKTVVVSRVSKNGRRTLVSMARTFAGRAADDVSSNRAPLGSRECNAGSLDTDARWIWLRQSGITANRVGRPGDAWNSGPFSSSSAVSP